MRGLILSWFYTCAYMYLFNSRSMSRRESGGGLGIEVRSALVPVRRNPREREGGEAAEGRGGEYACICTRVLMCASVVYVCVPMGGRGGGMCGSGLGFGLASALVRAGSTFEQARFRHSPPSSSLSPSGGSTSDRA